MKRTYNIGNSFKLGNLIAVSASLTEVTKDDFFNSLEKSINHYNLLQYKKEANLIKNLKLGVTIGDDYFLIKDRR